MKYKNAMCKGMEVLLEPTTTKRNTSVLRGWKVCLFSIWERARAHSLLVSLDFFKRWTNLKQAFKGFGQNL